MKKEFPGYFKISEEDRKTLFQSATIVFDTNVLLGIYRISLEAADAILKVTESLKERLWIPRQIAEEFFRNRIVVIEAQLKAYELFIEKISLDGEIKELRSERHPFVSPLKQKRLESAIQGLVDDLKKKKDTYEKLLLSDHFLERIAAVFEGRIGEAIDEKDYEKLVQEGKKRIEKGIPPGFEDKNKSGDKGLGDFVLWKQVLAYAKEQDKDVVFVTEDAKKDWWLESRGKTLGPRPELINEFHGVTGKKVLILRVASFLKEWEKEPKNKISKKAIEEISASTEIAATAASALTPTVDNYTWARWAANAAKLNQRNHILDEISKNIQATQDLATPSVLRMALEADLMQKRFSETLSSSNLLKQLQELSEREQRLVHGLDVATGDEKKEKGGN